MLEEGLADIEAVHQVPKKQFCVGLALAAAPVIAVSSLLSASSSLFGSDLGARHPLSHRNALRVAKKEGGKGVRGK